MKTHVRTHVKKDKLQEALELLNEAAQDKKEEVYEVLENKYGHLREFFESVASDGEAFAAQTKKQIAAGLHEEEKKIKEAAEQLDEQVHKKPWAFLGAAALGALVLGVMLGHKKNRNQSRTN